jgi:hypothetical protein
MKKFESVADQIGYEEYLLIGLEELDAWCDDGFRRYAITGKRGGQYNCILQEYEDADLFRLKDDWQYPSDDILDSVYGVLEMVGKRKK